MSARAWYRYYFIRRKAPVSNILWCNVMNRRCESYGSITDEWTDISVDTAVGTFSFNVLVEPSYSVPFATFNVPVGKRAAKRLDAALDALRDLAPDNDTPLWLWVGIDVRPEPGKCGLDIALVAGGERVASTTVRLSYRAACRVADMADRIRRAQRAAIRSYNAIPPENAKEEGADL